MKSLFISSLKGQVDKTWKNFLTDDLLLEIINIEKKIEGQEITPTFDKVLNFFNVPLDKVKVIILGQDPYPQKDIATGRAFEVNGLKSWSEKFQNSSLKNILRALYKLKTGNIKLFTEVVGSINDKKFDILSPDKIFKYWESQGVLLLNSSFTCSIGKPASHSKIWKNFSNLLIEYIIQERKNLIWFLWGAHAQNIMKDYDVIKKSSHHPKKKT